MVDKWYKRKAFLFFITFHPSSLRHIPAATSVLYSNRAYTSLYQPLGLEIEHRVTNESGGDWLKFGSVVMTEWRRDSIPSLLHYQT
jgi:hypothetical protein